MRDGRTRRDRGDRATIVMVDQGIGLVDIGVGFTRDGRVGDRDGDGDDQWR